MSNMREEVVNTAQGYRGELKSTRVSNRADWHLVKLHNNHLSWDPQKTKKQQHRTASFFRSDIIVQKNIGFT